MQRTWASLPSAAPIRAINLRRRFFCSAAELHPLLPSSHLGKDRTNTWGERALTTPTSQLQQLCLDGYCIIKQHSISVAWCFTRYPDHEPLSKRLPGKQQACGTFPSQLLTDSKHRAQATGSESVAVH